MKNPDYDTNVERESYAMVVLLLFYPFRDKDDLHIDGSYWEKYKIVSSTNLISKKSIEVLQNIQDCSYNCSMLKTAKDDLQCTTEYIPHDNDDKRNDEEDDNTFDVNDISDMFQQLDSLGVREVSNSKRSLGIIGKRHDITHQDIPHCTNTIPDVTNIPENITPFINDTSGKHKTSQSMQHNDKQHIDNSNNTMSCPMIIDILNDVVLKGLSINSPLTNDMQTNSLESLNDLSFQAIIQKYTLDFKQAVAFEIMASSFILKSLYTENISNDVLQAVFQANNEQFHKYTCSLSGLKQSMIEKGAMNNLVMFLSGMGGTGKK